MRFMKFLAGAGLAAMLAACGGGGGVGDSSGGGSGGGSGSTSTAASITLSASATSVSTAAGLPNSAVTITAEVRNASGTGVSNEPISFVADSGVLTDASTSTGTGPIAGVSGGSGVPGVSLGRATAVLSAGTNKAPRNITVTVTVGSVTKAIVLPVVSTVASIELTSSTVSLSSSAGSSVTITATVKNLANSGIVDEPVTFAADSGVLQNATPLTGQDGTATVLLSSGSNVSPRNITITVFAGAISKSIVIPVVVGSQVTGASLALSLVDRSGSPTNSVSAAGAVFAKAVLKDGAGNVVPNTKVTFATTSNLVNLKPAAEVLTDSQGVATVEMSAATLNSAGASTITAGAKVATVVVTDSRDFQLSPANLTLSALDVGVGALAAYGNRAVSVVANINGSPAIDTPVLVSFATSCGTVNPATATTDGTGKAATTYTADSANCAGTNVRITASSVGVTTPLGGTITVSSIQATNLQFIEAAPDKIYLRDSGAISQSQVKFKVVDSSGNPIQNQSVELELLNPNVAAGLSIDVLGSAVAVTKTTDALGQVTVAVFSGNVPTSVSVLAKLPAPSAIQTTSNTLTIASGRAVQRAASIALGAFSIEGLNIDGTETQVTLSLADRQGNAVPDGTAVNFVAESGVLIPARCVVAGDQSKCVATYRSQGTRPANGRVSILATVAGEEDFLDANVNNQYDPGEAFTDLGNAYRDDNESGDFTAGEFAVPRTGSSACPAVVLPAPTPRGFPNVVDAGRAGTCDGVWGPVEVRKSHVLVMASSAANIDPIDVRVGSITATISDANDNFDPRFGRNSMPAGTIFSAVKVAGNDDCTVKSVFPTTLANTYGPTDLGIALDKCQAGQGVVIGVEVRSPSGLTTRRNISIP